MKKWEYKTFQFNIESSNDSTDKSNETDLELAKFGNEGWELVSVMPVAARGIGEGTQVAIAYFKREQ